MGYRRFLDPTKDYSVSNAEFEIARELKKNNVVGYEPQKAFCLQSTIPDFYFPDINLVIYIDGEQVHQKRESRDIELRRLLKKRYGCVVRSYSYHAPITKARLKEIVDCIVDDVVGLRKMRT